MSASINPFRPPVEGAICAALDRVVHYPEREPRRLMEKLAEVWGVEPEQILVGNGATELIHFLAREGAVENVVLEIPAFGEFHRAWPEARCARFEDLPPDGFAVISQPSNPAGLGRELSGWDRAGLVDESFLDFTARRSLVERTRKHRDLLVLRSLTKFYALPGLRVGALVGHPDTIARLRERRQPWVVNVLAEEAALAALADPHWAQWSKQMIGIERNWLWEELARMPGIRPVRGEANFFLVYVEDAPRMCRWFLERKVILRDCTGWPGLEGEAVRIAVRRRDENRRFLDLLKEYLCNS